MKIALFGDVHGFFEHGGNLAIERFQEVVESIQADLLLQVGDLCYYRPLSQPLHWIYGNNDAPELVKKRQRAGRELKNLRLLNTGEIRIFSREREDLKLAGLNGAHDPLFYSSNGKEALDIRAKGFFVEEDIRRCSRLKGLDIFLTHGCPKGLGFRWQGKDIGDEPIRALLEEIDTRYFFCGHVHLFHRVRYKDTEIISLAEFKEEYYLFDSLSGELEQIRTSSLPGV